MQLHLKLSAAPGDPCGNLLALDAVAQLEERESQIPSCDKQLSS